jgi:ATP-dependent Clp protease protease subunit
VPFSFDIQHKYLYNLYFKGEAVTKKFEDFSASDRIDVSLLNAHTHFLVGEIEEENINNCIKWLVYENLDVHRPKILTLYINSTGGDLYQAFALIDIIGRSNHTVRTIGIGSIMSAAFLIFASGSKGERYIAPNTGIMCHQFTEGIDAKYHDIKAQMKESEYCNQRMLEILKQASGMAPSRIKSKLLPASDVYLTANELVDLGLADQVL